MGTRNNSNTTSLLYMSGTLDTLIHLHRRWRHSFTLSDGKEYDSYIDYRLFQTCRAFFTLRCIFSHTLVAHTPSYPIPPWYDGGTCIREATVSTIHVGTDQLDELIDGRDCRKQIVRKVPVVYDQKRKPRAS